MNTKKILNIAFVLILVSIIGNIVLFFFGNSPFNLIDIEEKRVISAKNIENLTVLSSVDNIEIVPHDSDEIEVYMKVKVAKTEVDDYKLFMTAENNQLKVQTNKRREIRFFNFSGLSKLYVKLPKKQYETLTVSAEVANIKLEHIQAKQFSLTTDVGNIHGKELEGKITGQVDVGNIKLNMKKLEHDINLRVDVGNIAVKTKEAPKALQTDLRNQVGNETIKLPNERSGLIGNGGPLVKLTADVGDVAILMDDE
ncbi:DUF4097 family beta strand repeat-containing protein [Metabacillus fastidiosus]|uniref:DUF4097 family beta strand repeat-containing protein n=1 Tax=Metabacillus fastidiosus TaxID=1458 RepID=UPI003D27DB3E